MYINFAFTAGNFDGGLFGVFLRNVVSEGDREVAVVGGGAELRTFEGCIGSISDYSSLQAISTRSSLPSFAAAII
ncbi:hypothetical protein NC651_011447 [Populus alba x Populus x berolinensis]|nr:hypothetical protein NC651_011447 [Populus alba x Populus x berolinensis]